MGNACYMKYLEQTTTENKRFIDYIKGSLIFIFFNFLGQIPLSLYIISQSDLVGEFTSHQDLFSKLPSNLTLFLILLPFAVVLPFIYLVVTRLHQRSFISLITPRDQVDYNKILFSFFLWGTVSALMVIFDYIMSPEDYVWNFKPLTFLILLLISVVMIPLQHQWRNLFFEVI